MVYTENFYKSTEKPNGFPSFSFKFIWYHTKPKRNQSSYQQNRLEKFVSLIKFKLNWALRKTKEVNTIILQRNNMHKIEINFWIKKKIRERKKKSKIKWKKIKTKEKKTRKTKTKLSTETFQIFNFFCSTKTFCALKIDFVFFIRSLILNCSLCNELNVIKKQNSNNNKKP